MNEKRNAVEALRACAIWLMAAGMGVGIPATLEPETSWWAFIAAMAFMLFMAYLMGKAIKRVEGLLEINSA